MIKIAFCIFTLLILCASKIPDRELESIQNLPLKSSGIKGMEDELVIYITGDGGWNTFSKGLDP